MKWNHKYYKKLQIGIDSVSLLLSLLLAVFIKKGGFFSRKPFMIFPLFFYYCLFGFWQRMNVGCIAIELIKNSQRKYYILFILIFYF